MSTNVRPQLVDMRLEEAQKKPSKKSTSSSKRKGPQLIDMQNVTSRDSGILDRIAALEEELAALKALLNH